MHSEFLLLFFLIRHTLQWVKDRWTEFGMNQHSRNSEVRKRRTQRLFFFLTVPKWNVRNRENLGNKKKKKTRADTLAVNTSYVVFVLFIQCDIAIKFHPDRWCNNRSLVPEKPAVVPWLSFHLPHFLFFFEKRWEMRKEAGLLSFLLLLWAQDCETKDPSMPTCLW